MWMCGLRSMTSPVFLSVTVFILGKCASAYRLNSSGLYACMKKFLKSVVIDLSNSGETVSSLKLSVKVR
ncbi:hypothetical protein ALQ03_200052 [Pseudomonas savastanoi pv. glycinea]|nr:hypothetical protein ALQ03_200052 [Pseudomonas savastanoi pv. glycinea]